MNKIDLNNCKFIISLAGNDQIKEFLAKAVNNFFEELDQYITDNNDEGVLYYATERTLASLFVSGNLRRDKYMTGIQEYGTICTKNNIEVNGRPDIFIKSGSNAIWIECKYFRSLGSLSSDHWDIPAWLDWDAKSVYSQVEIYYNSESKKLNNSYLKRYLVTLCFNVIKQNKNEHLKKADSELRSKASINYGKHWYYQVGFFNDDTNSEIGIEVYGTFSDDLAKAFSVDNIN